MWFKIAKKISATCIKFYYYVAQITGATLVLLLSVNVSAQEDQVINITDTITGNQEQPKVLYILPWKEAEDNAIFNQPLNRKINDTFGHIERSEHRRQIEFLEKLEQPQTSRAKGIPNTDK